jgi:penicillin-binding protein 1B
MILQTALGGFGLIGAISIAILIHSYLYYSKIVDARLASGYLTSRAGIYAAPRTLRVGQALSPDKLAAQLRRAGYIESAASDVWSGSFRVQNDQVVIIPRHVGEVSNAPDEVRVRFAGNQISELAGDGATLDSYTLEPEILTTDASMKASQRTALAYRDIPPLLMQAILSIEDRRFFEHRGVDLLGIGRALLRNAGDDHIGQGGSTITQQLVKNTYLSPERTFRRKYAEAMIAFTLERRLSKEDIFALYCNEVYLGQRGAASVRGVEQAAHIFFNKKLRDLTLSEAATIAGMIQSPSRYAPDRHAENAVERRNVVLDAMLRDGAITREQRDAAANEPLKVAPADDIHEALAPYFIDYVNRTVEAQLDAAPLRDERNLRVETTIDLDLQELAETAIKNQLARLNKIYQGRDQTPQAALVALDPKTGNVLAMVGGREYAESQMNRATDAQRQPGSVFKPIVYAAAIESGISPISTYLDAPHEFTYDGKRLYRPANYGNTYSMHDVTMRTGLVKSLNVVTVDVALRTGLTRVAALAKEFGLPKPEAYPALALGTTEVTPLQVASAYTAFVNNGERVVPHAVARITDTSGLVLNDQSTPKTEQVIKPTTAYMITDMLSDVIEQGTARAARGAVKRTAIAGKTGTSRDGWFVGYTPNLVCAVWIGFDDNKQLGLTGAEAALPAWTEFIKGALALRPELSGESFTRPAGITTYEIDPETGMLATGACPQRERIALVSALAPNFECYVHNVPSALNELTAAGQEATSSATQEASEDRSALTRATTSSSPQTLSANKVQALPSPQTVNSIGTVELPSAKQTRIEKDVMGRATLVNDMGGGSRHTQPR